MNDVLAALDLPLAVKVQTRKLLACISQAASSDELWRASDRAAGFVMGLETVEALDAESIKGRTRPLTRPPRRAGRRNCSDW